MCLRASGQTFRRALWFSVLLSIVLSAGVPVTVAVPTSATDPDATNAGTDNQVYEPGGEVTPPKLIHYVEPNFSPSSKDAFVEGTVRISTVVRTDGAPANLRVLKGLNAEEDQEAIDAVTQWRFKPGPERPAGKRPGYGRGRISPSMSGNALSNGCAMRSTPARMQP